ncbi:hypothetical protein GQ44DRAFT_705700 [Phaeosphaeriaceae sp. PMI808]|nr:hypothetical protein GQ44DRAFT_705700 [Phaeosphaeriaceae sp. PMI808]
MVNRYTYNTYLMTSTDRRFNNIPTNTTIPTMKHPVLITPNFPPIISPSRNHTTLSHHQNIPRPTTGPPACHFLFYHWPQVQSHPHPTKSLLHTFSAFPSKHIIQTRPYADIHVHYITSPSQINPSASSLPVRRPTCLATRTAPTAGVLARMHYGVFTSK